MLNVEREADNVYLNFTLQNTTGTLNEPARISNTYTRPLIENPTDYYGALVKFEIPLALLPLYVFPETPGFFKIGVVEYTNGGNQTGPITFVPAFMRDVEFVPNDATLQPSDPSYRYVYSYNRLLQFFSTALFRAWTDAGAPGGAGNEPYLTFDEKTALISVVMPKPFVDAPAPNPDSIGWTVCWNFEVQRLLPSFNVYFQNDPSLVQNIRAELNTVPAFYDYSYDLNADNYIFTQEYSTLDYINSVRKVIIQSNLLPSRKEYYPPPITLENNPANSNTIPIIGDFQINLNNVAGAQRQVALYEANPYRLFDLTSTSTLSSIDLKILWADQFNVIRPLYLTPNDSATVKLAFFSKKLYNSNNMVLEKL